MDIVANAWPSGVGILAIELYVPNYYVSQTELEKFDGVSAGKYTIGLSQDKMGFCSDLEDTNSLSLTVVRNLMEKHKIGYDQIGRLEVGTETILDKSKSVKTVLMQLFEAHGNTDIEGIDTTNACYGGTAAVFNSISWLESSAWDGRHALVVAGDISVYAKGPARPCGGCGAVAILLGPNAPLVFERGIRASYASHVYDFYKPDLGSEYPRVNGQLSVECYLKALDNCYNQLAQKAANKTGEVITLDSFDGVIFHSPYCKLVRKSFARMLLNDVIRMREAGVSQSNRLPCLVSLGNLKLEESYSDREVEKQVLIASQDAFNLKTKHSLYVASQVGNMYTASLYGALVSYLSKPISELCGNRLCLFSYGSGLQASMYTIRVSSRPTDKLAELLDGISDVRKRLEARMESSPQMFVDVMLLREKAYQRAPYKPEGAIDDLIAGTYYLQAVDASHRREYVQHKSCINGGNSC